MKKIFMICLVLCNVGSVLHAQRGFSIAMRFQPQTNWLRESNVSNSGRLGISMGPEFGYHLSERLGMSTGLLYSLVNKNTVENHYTRKINLNQLRIPALFEFNTNPEARCMFMMTAGAQLSALLGYSYSYGSVSASGKQVTLAGTSFSLDQRPFTTLQVGYILGIGIQFRLTDNLFLAAETRLDILEDTRNKYARTKINGQDLFFWNQNDGQSTIMSLAFTSIRFKYVFRKD